jgi:CRP/FNR family transcriptional regulator, anaerobic regulatory protein
MERVVADPIPTIRDVPPEGETQVDGGADGPLRLSDTQSLPELYEQLSAGSRDLRRLFREAPSTGLREGEKLVEAHCRTDTVFLLQRGWACRTRRLPRGNRSIIDIYLPGDFVGFESALHHHARDTIAMLTNGAAHALAVDTFLPAAMLNPARALAFVWATNVAQRRVDDLAAALRGLGGEQRIALALLGFHDRLRRRELLRGMSYHLPLTQRELGDYVGMTSIHVNRILRALREQRIVVVENHIVMIADYKRLARLASESIGDQLPVP